MCKPILLSNMWSLYLNLLNGGIMGICVDACLCACNSVYVYMHTCIYVCKAHTYACVTHIQNTHVYIHLKMYVCLRMHGCGLTSMYMCI